MPTIAALLVATPIWGFALRPPSDAQSLALGALEDGISARTISVAERVATAVSPDRALERPEDPLQPTKIRWSRAIVVSTAAAMIVTMVLGAIQFADEYGFHESYYDTACAQRTGVLDRCGDEVPWQHAFAGGFTAAGLIFGLLKSFFVDFDAVAREDSDWRIYEATRWIALGMGLAQATFGILIANAVRIGWADQAQDFQTLQGLSLGHMAFGVATLGVQVANAILLF